MMISTEEKQRRAWIKTELEHSMQALAMPADVQLRLYPKDVCHACELVEDFRHFSACYLGDNQTTMTAEQRAALVRLQEYLVDLDYQCWDQESLRTGAAWEVLRELAKRSLACFGWEAKPPPMRMQ